MEPSEKLIYLAARLPESDKVRLNNIIQLILDRVSDSEQISVERNKFLTDVEKYLIRKKPKNISDAQNEIDYLRYVRNAFAHREYIPAEAVRVAIPMFWRVVKNIADDWRGPELINLLSYSLKLKKNEFSEGGSTRAVIRKLEDVLNRLPEDEQLIRFRDMLLSIYDTEYFHTYIKHGRPGSARS